MGYKLHLVNSPLYFHRLRIAYDYVSKQFRHSSGNNFSVGFVQKFLFIV